MKSVKMSGGYREMPHLEAHRVIASSMSRRACPSPWRIICQPQLLFWRRERGAPYKPRMVGR